MRRAKAAGYKVYLYFVSTETPEINIDRVGIRVKSGEHNVPRYKIIKRYYRSHKLLYKAVKLSYQSFFFDNSKTGEKFKLFAQLKSIKGKENWIRYDKPLFPSWFKRYYLNKII
jgi:predicted ABC-type ATPase